MTNTIINDEAIDEIFHTLDSFVWTSKDSEELETLRQQFVRAFDKPRIDNLTREDYFAGLGRKQGCLAYDLEWGTGKLGSIKGGSKYKYGYESDFTKIRSLLQKVTSIDTRNVYKEDGSLTVDIEKIVTLSKDINGFKTGRTVIPKMLSIYYPDTFVDKVRASNPFRSKPNRRRFQ